MKKFLPLIVLSLVTFSACSSSEPVTQEQDTSDLGNQVLDEQFYKQAVDAQNKSLCGDIVNETLKTECTAVVESLLTTTKAVQKADLKLCSTVAMARFQSSCKTQVQAELDRRKALENLTKEVEANGKIDAQALAKDDETICAQIQDENQLNACYYNVLTNRALSKNDIKLCKQIPAKEYAQNCETTFAELK